MPIEKKRRSKEHDGDTLAFSGNGTVEIRISSKSARTLESLLGAEIARRGKGLIGPDTVLEYLKKVNSQIAPQLAKGTVAIDMDAFQLRILKGVIEKKDPNGVKKEFIEIIDQLEMHEAL